jgi:hypothetical protein
MPPRPFPTFARSPRSPRFPRFPYNTRPQQHPPTTFTPVTRRRHLHSGIAIPPSRSFQTGDNAFVHRLSPVLSSCVHTATSASSSGKRTGIAPTTHSRSRHTSSPPLLAECTSTPTSGQRHYATLAETQRRKDNMTVPTAPMHVNGQLTPPLTPNGLKKTLREHALSSRCH